MRLQCEQRRMVQIRLLELGRAVCLFHDWAKSQFKHRICQLLALDLPMIRLGILGVNYSPFCRGQHQLQHDSTLRHWRTDGFSATGYRP